MTTYTKQPVYKNKKGKTKWSVIVRRTDNNNVIRVWGKKTGTDADGNKQFKFKASHYRPDGDGWKWRMSKERSLAAEQWAQTKDKYKIYRSKERWPMLSIYNQVGRWDVADDLQKAAFDIRRWLRCGWQRSKHDQFTLRQGWLKGYSGYNLAAKCCSRSDIHPYSDKKSTDCVKHGPCQSNHCDRTGKGGEALDTSVLHGSKSSSNYTGIRSWPAKGSAPSGNAAIERHNLHAFVQSEDWHVSRSGG